MSTQGRLPRGSHVSVTRTIKLPQEAFTYYLSLGETRSYRKVAEHFGVDKRTVAHRAMREGWQDRLNTIEEMALSNVERSTIETIEEMNNRHLKTLKAIQGKAIDVLKSMPIESAMDAVRAIDIAIKQERVIRGEPSDRTAVDVERVIREEYQRLMLAPAQANDWSQFEEANAENED